MTQATRFKHPECGPDEVFLGNTTNLAGEDGRNEWDSIGWKSKRRGNVPYDSDGKIIMGGLMFPVFVSRKELEAKGVDLEKIIGPYGK